MILVMEAALAAASGAAPAVHNPAVDGPVIIRRIAVQHAVDVPEKGPRSVRVPVAAPPAPPAPPPPPAYIAPPAPPAPPVYVAPPAPPPPVSRAATPINRAEWVQEWDYPPLFYNKRVGGRVAFALIVSEYGVPTSCTVETSSGYPEMDSYTCDLIMRRARFDPARSPSGVNIPGIYRTAVVWQR